MVQSACSKKNTVGWPALSFAKQHLLGIAIEDVSFHLQASIAEMLGRMFGHAAHPFAVAAVARLHPSSGVNTRPGDGCLQFWIDDGNHAKLSSRWPVSHRDRMDCGL